MSDPYDELDVFGRSKSRVGGVPYVTLDDDLIALQNYVLNLEAKEAAIESGARTVRKPKEIKKEGRRAPAYVHEYDPGYTASEEARLLDERDPVRFMPVVRQGAENVRAIYGEGADTPSNIFQKVTGAPAPRGLWRLQAQPTFEDRWNNNLIERTQTWLEKMVRSGASLPADVMSGRVISGPGLRATDFSDVPGAPNPLSSMIERTQDLAGLAMGGSIPELAARGVDRNALGTGPVPKQPGGGFSPNVTNWLEQTRGLTNEFGGGNVPPSIARNIGRETMPEILARQRASEGMEAAIRDPETKKLYTGMWHEEVLDKIAKDRGVPKDQLPTNLVKGYVNDRGRFISEEQAEKASQNKSKTAMFRADDEVGAAVAALHATEGKAPELKVGEANLPAVIPQGGGLMAPGSAINPISNRRGFLRGARDMMAAASNANKIVSMAEKLGQTPIPKMPKVPLKEIWKTGEIPADVIKNAEEYAREMLNTKFEDAHPQFEEHDWGNDAWEKKYQKAWDEFAKKDPEFREIVDDYAGEWTGEHEYEGGTQFSHHQLPGATNYREHLMQMPEQQHPQFKNIDKRPITGADIDLANRLAKEEPPRFYGDWDEPDIIGHSRVNDRQIPNVGKSLHIEEIGSQLHEKGAKEGYGKVDTSKWTVKDEGKNRIVKDQDGVTRGIFGKGLATKDAIAKAAERDVAVPDLPFKKTHVDIAVNRMLHEAAAQGYDAVSWTPHELQKKHYGNDSNKEVTPRIEALAKKYGGKVEKAPVSGFKPTIVGNNDVGFRVTNEKGEVLKQGMKTHDEAKSWADENVPQHKINVMKLTPEMKRIFGHDDFSMFLSDKMVPQFEIVPTKYKNGETTYGVRVTGVEDAPYTEGLFKTQKQAEKHIENETKRLQGQSRSKLGFKLRSDSEAGAAVGALHNATASTFYSGLGRTIERAPFETATPSQWAKHLRDTVGERQAEEFEHVGLEGKVGPLKEVKQEVQRPAQGALEEWKKANPKQRPPKELIDAASNENKRLVEQKIADRTKEAPLTKAELLAHVKENQPKFKEIVKRADEETSIQTRAQEIMNEEHPEIKGNHPRYYDYFDEAVHRASDELEGTATKYSDYQLPGGTNYREHLLTMPSLDPPRPPITTSYLYKNGQRVAVGDESAVERWRAADPNADVRHVQEPDNRAIKRSGESNHYSSHWPEDPNVIVHTRMNDRILSNEAPKVPTFEEWAKYQKGVENWTPAELKKEYEIEKQKGLISQNFSQDGLKSLHAEEFQSDLHQEGRKKGYKGEAGKLLNKTDRTPQEEARMGAIVEHGTTGGVPNFPFKKSWPDLAIKRWLREAVDNDYDAVSWTPGEAQRDRFQLGHHIENLYYDKRPDGTYILGADKRGGGTHPINRNLPIKESELAGYVGEAVAEKIKKGEGRRDEHNSYNVLENQDLKVGGGGLVSFYDKTVKGKVEALVEKFGGKVEKHKIPHPGGRTEDIIKQLGYTEKAWRAITPAKRAELMNTLDNNFVWSVKLTPEMKAAIKREGFPLFSAGPVLTPVDHDPFDKKEAKKPKLQPVEHDPFAQPTPDMGGKLNKLISAAPSYRPRPQPVQNGFDRRQ